MTDRWAPAWDLQVNKKTLGPEYKRLVSSITVDATVDGADELRIEAAAWDPDKQVFRIIGEDLFAPGNSVIARIGYGSERPALQRFRLLREEGHYPENGVPTVTIRGYSAEHRMVECTKPRTFAGPIADSEIARQIADEHGMTVTVGSLAATAPYAGDRVKEAGKTDLEFLQALALANDFGPPKARYDEDLDADVFFFRPLNLLQQDERATFIYNPWLAGSPNPVGTLRNFEPTLSLAGVPTRVEVVGYDPVEQRLIKVVVEIGQEGQPPAITDLSEIQEVPEAFRSGSQLYASVLNAGDTPEFDKTENVTVYSVRTVEDAVAWARRWIRTRNQAYLVARATVVGYERLWCGQVHRIEGVAPTHVGLWAVDVCRHVVDSSGYRCDLDLSYVLDKSAEPREV